MKNCEPPVFGPALAIETVPGALCCKVATNSSLMAYPGSPVPSPAGAASLNHETVNHSVESQAIIETALAEFHKVLNCNGSLRGK